MLKGEDMSSDQIKDNFFVDLGWGTNSVEEKELLPEWAYFLVSLGSWIADLKNLPGRLFCAVLLPSRICASSLIAFGAICSSLADPSDELSWETFLDCENGTHVYFLHNEQKKGKRQIEGTLGEIKTINGQMLRKIEIDSKRKEFKNLNIFISKSKFKDANVAFHSHHRTTLLNSLDELSNKYKNLISGFNENRLLHSQTECIILTNQAAWEREIDSLALSNVNKKTEPSLLTELLMLKYGRVKLLSPRSREIGNVDTDFTILDGIDSLRSRENIKSKKTLILLDQNEYQEEVEDIIHSFSDCSDLKVPVSISKPTFICPPSIGIQLYFFSEQSKC